MLIRSEESFCRIILDSSSPTVPRHELQYLHKLANYTKRRPEPPEPYDRINMLIAKTEHPAYVRWGCKVVKNFGNEFKIGNNDVCG